MKTRNSQRGISSLSWLVIIMVGGFVLTCALKLGPVYADNFMVRDALRSLTELSNNDRTRDLPDSAIRTQLNNYFTINNLRDVPRTAIAIERKAENVLVNINYERRVPLFYNIDVVMTFTNQFDSRRPTECCKPQSE